MTGFTILFDRKGGVTIVTGTTVFALVHSIHRHVVPLVHRLEEVGMAGVAGEVHVEVCLVRERSLAGILIGPFQIAGMAGCAVGLDGKSGIAIVTGAAIFTIVHGAHRHAVAIELGREEVGVTGVAGKIHIEMCLVREHGLAADRIAHRDIAGMAGGAIPFG